MTELQRHKEAVAYVAVEMRKLSGLDYAMTTEHILCEMDKILNPPPAVETVEVDLGTRWMHKKRKEIYSQKPAYHALPEYEEIKLTGTFTREVQKVERSVSVEAYVDSLARICANDRDGRSALWYEHECHGKTGTLTFTWEE